MKRTYRDYILDILTSIQEIEEFVEGMNFEEFVEDRKTVNAVIRSLEVMGEAVKKKRSGRNTKKFHGNTLQV